MQPSSPGQNHTIPPDRSAAAWQPTRRGWPISRRRCCGWTPSHRWKTLSPRCWTGFSRIGDNTAEAMGAEAMADILIAGAGLGGLTAALALIQRGHRVRVFEQAAELREVGAGVQLGANGTRILIALGLEPAMQQVVCAATSKEIRLGSTGQCWPTFDLGETSVERFGAHTGWCIAATSKRCCW